MPRPADGLFPRIASFVALEAAAQRAARGKWCRPGVADFLALPEREVLRLERELLSGAWRPGRYVEIAIRDPKPRTPAKASRSWTRSLSGPSGPATSTTAPAPVGKRLPLRVDRTKADKDDGVGPSGRSRKRCDL